MTNPQKDFREIERLAGYKTGKAAWDQLELYGLRWVFGFDEGPAPTDAELDVISPIHSFPSYQEIKAKKVTCERIAKGNRCGAGYNLTVVYPRYEKGAPENFGFNEPMLLCQNCLKEEKKQWRHRRRMARQKNEK